MKIIVYDNEKTFDRYTIIIGRDVYSMSENALSPQGYNQYCFTLSKKQQISNVGKRVPFNALPEAVKKAIKRRLI